jgi:hypothetical protein
MPYLRFFYAGRYKVSRPVFVCICPEAGKKLMGLLPRKNRRMTAGGYAREKAGVWPDSRNLCNQVCNHGACCSQVLDKFHFL